MRDDNSILCPDMISFLHVESVEKTLTSIAMLLALIIKESHFSFPFSERGNIKRGLLLFILPCAERYPECH